MFWKCERLQISIFSSLDPLTTQGATLYMVCRSKERAEAARDEIVAAAAGHRSGGSNLSRGLLFRSAQTEVELVY